MKHLYKALRDALIANSTLTALIPAGSIYAEPVEITSFPAIVILKASQVNRKFHGSRVDGVYKSTFEFQVSIYIKGMANLLDASQEVSKVLLIDNSTLNAAGVRNIQFAGSVDMYEDGVNLYHRINRYRFDYINSIN